MTVFVDSEAYHLEADTIDATPLPADPWADERTTTMCNHPYDEMVWRISCHVDLMSTECRESSQRSAMCCDRTECLTATSHWVAGAGHGVHRAATRCAAVTS